MIKAEGSTVVTVEALVLKEFNLSDDKTLLLGPVYDLTMVSGASVNGKQDTLENADLQILLRIGLEVGQKVLHLERGGVHALECLVEIGVEDVVGGQLA